MHDVATDGVEKPRGVQGTCGTYKWVLATGSRNSSEAQ